MPEVIRVVSRRAPSIAWSCPTCGDRQPFDCSERFRANSSGKRIDIWLIYRCRRCEATKNLTVVERTPVSKVPRLLLDAAQENDATVARSLARDLALLRRNRAMVAEGDDWFVDASAACDVVLDLPEPLLVRADAVIAASLGLGRGQLRRSLNDGDITVDGCGRLDALRLCRGPIRVTRSA